jgi:photosystem II stability/assembly factor-like uncharacterized protein
MTNKSNSRHALTSVFIYLLVLAGLINSIVIPFSLKAQASSLSAPKKSTTPPSKTHPTAAETGKTKDRIEAAFSELPLRFEANRGQASAKVKFLARGKGYDLFLTETGSTLSFNKPVVSTIERGRASVSPGRDKRSDQPTSLSMKLLGANSNARVGGIGEQPGKSNYFRGSDPKKWQTNIPSYQSVKYSSVYPGIDLTYYERDQQLEYDFTVAPGANPNLIRLDFEGANRIEIDAQGDLILHTPNGDIRHRKPAIYQEVNGTRREVIGNYRIVNKQMVGFRIGNYDRAKPLVIDPAIAYSSFFGGASSVDIATYTDANGVVYTYMVGAAQSSGFPTKNAGYENPASIYIAKFNTSLSGEASLIYSTYIQSGPIGSNTVAGIAVDSLGNAYITGHAISNDFPVVNAFQATNRGPLLRCGECDSFGDAFITKLSADGAEIIYSTYLGGTNGEEPADIAVDSAGNAYITGWTESNDFPMVNAFQPIKSADRIAFVSKITVPIGASFATLAYSTYLGGSVFDMGKNIATDLTGNIHVTGWTDSSDFPTLNALQSSYVDFVPHYNPIQNVTSFYATLNPALSGTAAMVYSTYLNSSAGTEADGLAIDPSGNAYISGTVRRSILGHNNFVTTPGSFQPVVPANDYLPTEFVMKLDATKSGITSLIYSTYIGGAGGLGGIAVDSEGHAFITGITDDPNFPIVNGLQSFHSGVLTSVDGGTHLSVSSSGLRNANISALAIDPNVVPRTIYAGSRGGGIFKSTDGGANWVAINAGLSDTNILDIALSPSNSQIVYAATDNAIFKSLDGGANWGSLNAGITGPIRQGWGFGRHNLTFDTRTMPATLYITASDGLYKMQEGANTWNVIPLPGIGTVPIFNLKIDSSTSPSTLYAMEQDGLFRSQNGGDTWTHVPTDRYTFSDFAIDTKTTPSTFYGYDPDFYGGANALVRSIDGGNTWEMVSEVGGWDSFEDTSGALTLDQSTPVTTIYVTDVGGGIVKSIDGGNSWIPVLNLNVGASEVVIDPASASPTTPATIYSGTLSYQTDVFVTELNSTGSALLFSTYLGGMGYDQSYGINLDSSGNIYVTGNTQSPDFPLANAYQTTLGGAFIVKIGNAGLPSTSTETVTRQVGLQSGTLSLSFPNITGSTTSTPPTVTVNPIDSQTVGNLTLSNNLGAYEIKTTGTYDTSGYASDPTKGIKLAFTVLTVNEPAVFNNLVITHGEDSNGDGIIQPGEMIPYNGTVDPNKITYRDFASRTVWAYVSSFSPFVIVKGATDQFSDMVRLLKSYNLKAGIQNSLDGKLQNALKAYQAALAKDRASACNLMVAFNNEVLAQTGKALTKAQATQLISTSNQIKLVVGCR